MSSARNKRCRSGTSRAEGVRVLRAGSRAAARRRVISGSLRPFIGRSLSDAAGETDAAVRRRATVAFLRPADVAVRPADVAVLPADVAVLPEAVAVLNPRDLSPVSPFRRVPSADELRRFEFRSELSPDR